MRSSTIRDRLARHSHHRINLFETRTLTLFVHTLCASVRTSNRFTLFWCLAWNYQLSFSSRNALQQYACSFLFYIHSDWNQVMFVIDLIYIRRRNQDLPERKRANKMSIVAFDANISLARNFVLVNSEFKI